MKPQTKRVLQYLVQHGRIKPLEALDKMGIYRLASRISELRHYGFGILTRKVKTYSGKYVAEYTLVDNYILTAWIENEKKCA